MACGGCAARRAARNQQKVQYEVTYGDSTKETFDTYAQAKSAVRRKGSGSIRTKTS